MLFNTSELFITSSDLISLVVYDFAFQESAGNLGFRLFF